MFLLDMTSTGWILFGVALVVGIVIGGLLIFFLPVFSKRRAENNSKKIINNAEIKADHIIKNAQLDAKQTIFELKQEAEKDIKERKETIVQQENKLLQREQSIN